MLKRVHIKGFRSCRDVEFDDLGELVALVGPNGSGKSNILQAITETARLASWNDPMPLGWREIILNSTIELNFELDSAEYRYHRTQLPDAPYDIIENLSRRDGVGFVTILDR